MRRKLFALVASLILLGQSCTNGVEPRAGLYVMPVGTTRPQLVAATAGPPIWSPHDDSMAWNDGDGITIRTPVGDIRHIWPGQIAGSPSWSRDGERLAFVDFLSQELVITTVSSRMFEVRVPVSILASGSRPPALATFGGPAWSPDGERLAFTCWDGAGDEVCVVGADGSGLRQITRVAPAGDGAGFAGAHLGPAVWSPDGALFAVAAYPERRGAASGVFVVDPQRGSSNRVSELVPSSALIWGSDGDAVVFAATSDGRSDVFQVETAGGEVHNLTSSLAQPARDPALAPQGGRLAVASGGAIVVFAAGTASPELTVRAANDLRASQPAWSADGETLAFTASADPITTYDS